MSQLPVNPQGWKLNGCLSVRRWLVLGHFICRRAEEIHGEQLAVLVTAERGFFLVIER